MHITLTGNLGSGKSTICKILNETYGFEVYSTGKVQREIAREMNMTTLELSQLMCSDHKYDTMIDDATAKISRENKDKNIVFDSRLAWNFVESSFKVFLSVSLDVAANRVYLDNRGAEEKYSSVAEAKELLRERANTEKRRYKDIYDLDYFDFSNYNLVLDSTYCTPEKIAEVMMHQAKLYEEGKQDTSLILVSPKRLLDEKKAADISDDTEENGMKVAELTAKYKNGVSITNDVITVKEENDTYVVVAGKAFAKAAYIAGVDYVPVVIK